MTNKTVLGRGSDIVKDYAKIENNNFGKGSFAPNTLYIGFSVFNLRKVNYVICHNFSAIMVCREIIFRWFQRE